MNEAVVLNRRDRGHLERESNLPEREIPTKRNSMDYVNFGKSGVKVSRIALGLGLRGQADPVQARRMIEAAIDRGINFLDCANVYGTMDVRANFGQSEEILGQAIKGKRDDVVITSKVRGEVGSGPNDSGLSRYHILREIENSLRRLNTDHLDLYLVHSYDEDTPLEETVGALDDVVRSGKARYVGCCNLAAWQVCRALWVADRMCAHPFVGVQHCYSLLNREIEAETFSLIRDRGLGAMAYSPLAVGLLTGVYRKGHPPPGGTLWATRFTERYGEVMDGPAGEIVEATVAAALELGKSPAQVAIAWILSHPEISCAISGADNIDQLEDVIGAVGWRLPDEIRERLDRISAVPGLAVK